MWIILQKSTCIVCKNLPCDHVEEVEYSQWHVSLTSFYKQWPKYTKYTQVSSYISLYLFWNLAEIVDKADSGIPPQRVLNTVDVHVALVEQVMEDVDRLHGRRTLLPETEDEVDPLVEVRAHIVTL